jgi:hypothetical protein
MANRKAARTGGRAVPVARPWPVDVRALPLRGTTVFVVRVRLVLDMAAIMAGLMIRLGGISAIGNILMNEAK